MKQCVVENYREAQEIKKENPNVVIERGRMAYKKYETAMDYLEQCINKFRGKRSRRKLKKLSDILISSDLLYGQVWYPQVHRILDMVRNAKKSIAEIWTSDNGFSNCEKRNLTEDIRQECVEYVCNTNIGEKTMRYLVEQIDSKECSDISRFLFGVLFGTPNEEFFKLIQTSKTPIEKLVEDANGDVQIYDFRYKKELI